VSALHDPLADEVARRRRDVSVARHEVAPMCLDVGDQEAAVRPLGRAPAPIVPDQVTYQPATFGRG
jgi:hypothetical protein